ncbi:hypothetical protein AWR38_03440 [Idiomarina sp. WRN-38]|uniref:hypothetical protein n=1 Tax=Idiomarina sp. OXR-189 TaxID=3100175 RepID=UPI000733801B|nr:hypothetical protein [Idiomarina sp. OXR-189]KTG24638.1 hypothetical protein AUR68_03435 [Idiomarina sp. H105]OAE93144.1 hypothetical protein AWR38_03440 [Idiomarina sp. WRN-38]WPZ01245.1 hypothetical protein UM402_12320 [Idiomarina sp. OXR-189]|tara:strand:- start:3270 stop:4103 length:834 start_codon:yes stop_codon:yes gene_type:complete
MRQFFAFDPHKSFFQLRVVQATILLGFLTAAVISVIIASHSNLITKLDYEGFNFFVKAYKVPIGVLASLIPVIALLAANHRSVQTKEQIRVTQSNNNFSNFFKHQQAFEEYTSSINPAKSRISNFKTLHKAIFPDARSGDLAVGSSYSESLEKLSSDISEGLSRLAQETPFEEKVDVVIELTEITRNFGLSISVSTSFGGSGTRVKSSSGQQLVVQDGDLSFVLKDIASNLKNFVELAQFDSEFSEPESLEGVRGRLKKAPKLLSKQKPSGSYKYSI